MDLFIVKTSCHGDVAQYRSRLRELVAHRYGLHGPDHSRVAQSGPSVPFANILPGVGDQDPGPLYSPSAKQHSAPRGPRDRTSASQQLDRPCPASGVGGGRGSEKKPRSISIEAIAALSTVGQERPGI